MSTDPHVENTVKDDSSDIFSPLLCGPVPHSICTAELLWYYAIYSVTIKSQLCAFVYRLSFLSPLCHVMSLDRR